MWTWPKWHLCFRPGAAERCQSALPNETQSLDLRAIMMRIQGVGLLFSCLHSHVCGTLLSPMLQSIWLLKDKSPTQKINEKPSRLMLRVL